MKLLIAIQLWFLNYKLKKATELERSLNIQIKDVFGKIMDRFDQRSKQLDIEKEKIEALRKNMAEMDNEQWTTALQGIRSPFTTGNEIELDELENEMDEVIVKLKSVVKVKNELTEKIDKLKT